MISLFTIHVNSNIKISMDIEIARTALKVGCATFNLQPSVTVAEIKHGTVWVLAFDQDPSYADFGRKMIVLERWLKSYTGESNIELQCESIADKNRRDIKSGRRVAPMVNARNVETLD